MADAAAQVCVQVAGKNLVAGTLWAHRRRNTESATFAYDEDYLTHPDAYALDPALPLLDGPQQSPAGHPIFGAFSDCAPDRWGRRLIERAERRRAKREDDVERSFGEIDYLLGVRDAMRQGALRFRVPATTEFVAGDEDGVPPLLALPKLLAAAEHLERDEADEEDLKILLRGGSSLGGARPKAHVVDHDGRPAIAKFPKLSDEWEVTRWEHVALTLARRAGIEASRSRIDLADGAPVLVIDRFDRSGDERIGYVSAMTMLEARDGEDGGSYLEIADAIERSSPAVDRDLHELWRRIAFSILISNTDDHLRNHGFLRMSTAGWSLSPAFDLNPNPAPGPKELSTAIDFGERRASIEVLLDVAEHFRLSPDNARRIVAETVAATAEWRKTAAGAGLDRANIESMAPAFEHEEAAAATDASKSLL